MKKEEGLILDRLILVKKNLCLLTACLMVLSLFGCSAEKEKPAEAPTEKKPAKKTSKK